MPAATARQTPDAASRAPSVAPATPVAADALSEIYGTGATPSSRDQVAALRTELSGLVQAATTAFVEVREYMVPKLADDIGKTCITIARQLRDSLRLSDRILSEPLSVNEARDAASSLSAALGDSKDTEMVQLRRLLGVPGAPGPSASTELLERFERLHDAIREVNDGPVRLALDAIEAKAAEATRLEALHVGARTISRNAQAALTATACDIVDVERRHRIEGSLRDILTAELDRLGVEIEGIRSSAGQKAAAQSALAELQNQRAMCQPLAEVCEAIAARFDSSISRTDLAVQVNVEQLRSGVQALREGNPIDGTVTSTLPTATRERLAAIVEDGISALSQYDHSIIGGNTAPAVSQPKLTLGEINGRDIGLQGLRVFLVAEADAVTMKIVSAAPVPGDRGATHPLISLRVGTISASGAVGSASLSRGAELPTDVSVRAIEALQCVASNQQGVFARYGGFDPDSNLMSGLRQLARDGTISHLAEQSVDRRSLARADFSKLPSTDMRLGKEIDPERIGIAPLRAFMVVEQEGVYLKLVTPPSGRSVFSPRGEHSVLSIRIRNLETGQSAADLNSNNAAISPAELALVGRLMDLVRQAPTGSFLANGKFNAQGPLATTIETHPGVLGVGQRDVSAKRIQAGNFS